MQNGDTFLKKIHLLIYWHLLVQSNHPLACLVHIKEVKHSLFEELVFVGRLCFSSRFGGLGLFGQLGLHLLVDLDALKGSDLSNMLLERRVATSYSNHNLVCLE